MSDRALRCLRCSAALLLSQRFCRECGAPADADKDGIPDALERLVEQKLQARVEQQEAKAIAEKNAQAAARADAWDKRQAAEIEARCAADEKAREAGSRAQEDALAASRSFLQALRARKRPIFNASRNVFLVALTVSLTLTLVSGGVEFFADRSIAGPVFCSFVCDGCSGPGRGFRIYSSTVCAQGNQCTAVESVFVCNNPSVDVENIDAYHAASLSRYQLSTWIAVPVYVLLFGILGSLTIPFLSAKFMRDRMAIEEKRILAEVLSKEAALGISHVAQPDPKVPYR